MKKNINIKLPKLKQEPGNDMIKAKSIFSLLDYGSNAYKELSNTGEDLFLKIVSAVVENTQGIMITNPEGRIEYINPAFETMTGYSKEEAVGQLASVLRSDNQSPEFYKNLWRTILAGKVFQSEVVNQRKDGVLFRQEQTIVPIKDKNGKITHFVSTGRDITEEKREANHLMILGKIAVPIIDQIREPAKAIQTAAFNLRDYVRQQKDLQPYKDLEKIYNVGKQIDEVLQILSKFIEPSTAPRFNVSVSQIFGTAMAQLQAELSEHKVKVVFDIEEGAKELEVNPEEWQFVFFQLTHHALEGLPIQERFITWTVKRSANELKLILASSNRKILSEIPITCNRYSHFYTGNVDLEFLLAEKIIGDYGANLSYRLREEELLTEIILPQKGIA